MRSAAPVCVLEEVPNNTAEARRLRDGEVRVDSKGIENLLRRCATGHDPRLSEPPE